VHRIEERRPFFEHVLQKLGFWDMGVGALLKEGVPLVGLQTASPGYNQRLVLATLTEKELLQTAQWRRKSLMSHCKQFSQEDEQAYWIPQMMRCGFLQGPYMEQQILVSLETEEWLLNLRFVLFQGTGGKVRVIYDAQKSAVNSTYMSTVKLQLQDIDYAAYMFLAIMAGAAAAGAPLSDWKGKPFDLSKAYKQMAILPSHQITCCGRFPNFWRVEFLPQCVFAF